MPLPSEPVQAHITLTEMAAHEPVALRWAEARTNLLREAFAEAYRALVGVHPARRAELRAALEEIRAGAARGDASVESVLGRLQLNGESGAGA